MLPTFSFNEPILFEVWIKTRGIIAMSRLLTCASLLGCLWRQFLCRLVCLCDFLWSSSSVGLNFRWFCDQYYVASWASLGTDRSTFIVAKFFSSSRKPHENVQLSQVRSNRFIPCLYSVVQTSRVLTEPNHLALRHTEKVVTF